MAEAEFPDTTRSWVNTIVGNTSNMLKPTLVLRIATDSNYRMNSYFQLPAYGNSYVNARAIMNTSSPGMRIPGVTAFNVEEAIDTITSTGSLQLINALPVSKITTTLTSDLPSRIINPQIRSQVVINSVGVPKTLIGDRRATSFQDGSNSSNTSNPYFREDQILYRVFENETIYVTDNSGFPDPAVPIDEMQDELGGANQPDSYKGTYWFGRSGGVGAYFVLIDDEVVRVVDYGAGHFDIPPGGRGINNLIQHHSIGATVTLLGFPPYTGDFVARNYLVMDDFMPYMSLLRPGTALVSYEGYGHLSGDLVKNPRPNQPYAFTGYWFTGRNQATETDDGKPLMVVDIAGPGYAATSQKISQTLLYKSKTAYGSWANAAFDAAGLERKIGGEQYDYHGWDPTLPGAFPLKISTELAQNKAFFDHMRETENGLHCEICQKEFADYIAAGHSPTSIAAARVVGQHIYRESIRVFNKTGKFGAGPIRTYLRLMMQLAIGAWENDVDRTPLAQRWTKMPTVLFNNLTDFENNMVWNGQLSFKYPGQGNPDNKIRFDVEGLSSEDHQIIGKKVPLTCAFTSSYDNQEFTAPMQDFADINGMTLYIRRNGKPVFMPIGTKLRGFNTSITSGEWFLSQGKSITSYSHDVDPSTVVTNCIVTATTAFSTDISVAAGGTAYDLENHQMVWYSGKIGNKQGLQLTGGVLKFDTLSLDNLQLGFNWYTDGTAFGLPVIRDGKTVSFYRMPTLPDGTPKLKYNDNYTKNHKTLVKQIQVFIAFLVIRRYIQALQNINVNATTDNFGLQPNGSYDKNTEQYVKRIQNWLLDQMSTLRDDPTESTKKPLSATGVWDNATYYWVNKWATKYASFIKTDIWWWTVNGLEWDQYVMHILGIPIPQLKDNSGGTGEAQWSIDQLGLRSAEQEYAQRFATQMYNAGNRVVDASLSKATVRSLTTNVADPRIEIGDVIWVEIPGHLSAANVFGERKAPFTNGVYITNISRAMDLEAGTYSATYSGYRYRGDFNSKLLRNWTSYYGDTNSGTARQPTRVY